MARELVLLKLGGSLITDKTRSGVARHAAIRRLARELAAITRNPRAPRLIVGHGSGSFGHAAAATGGLTVGVDATRRLDAISRTQRRAADLHGIVIAALVDAGARPFSLSPSSFLFATNGKLTGRFADPLFAAVDLGLLPVVYGDVVLDRTRGATIVSTEAVFVAIVMESCRRKKPIARAVWLGETDGVADRNGQRIEQLAAGAALRSARAIKGASGVDVTGGMALRLRTAGILAKEGVSSAITDGRKPGAIAHAIAGRAAGGTVVFAR